MKVDIYKDGILLNAKKTKLACPNVKKIQNNVKQCGIGINKELLQSFLPEKLKKSMKKSLGSKKFNSLMSQISTSSSSTNIKGGGKSMRQKINIAAHSIVTLSGAFVYLSGTGSYLFKGLENILVSSHILPALCKTDLTSQIVRSVMSTVNPEMSCSRISAQYEQIVTNIFITIATILVSNEVLREGIPTNMIDALKIIYKASIKGYTSLVSVIEKILISYTDEDEDESTSDGDGAAAAQGSGQEFESEYEYESPSDYHGGRKKNKKINYKTKSRKIRKSKKKRKNKTRRK